MITARDAKSFFAYMAKQDTKQTAEPMTEKRVQKMLYFAQGHCLQRYSRKLFDEPIEAWPHGPVVPAVYEKAKADQSGYLPVDPDPSFDLDAIPYEDFELMTDVYCAYNRYTTEYLESMTHKPGGPWSRTMKSTSQVIPTMSIADYFRAASEIGIEKDVQSIPRVGYISHGKLILPAEWEDQES